MSDLAQPCPRIPDAVPFLDGYGERLMSGIGSLIGGRADTDQEPSQLRHLDAVDVLKAAGR